MYSVDGVRQQIIFGPVELGAHAESVDRADKDVGGARGGALEGARNVPVIVRRNVGSLAGRDGKIGQQITIRKCLFALTRVPQIAEPRFHLQPAQQRRR